MNADTFEKIWGECGLDEYYTRMKFISECGYKFDDIGDMDRFESEAIDEYLRITNKTLALLTDDELTELLPSIQKRASVLRKLSKKIENITYFESNCSEPKVLPTWERIESAPKDGTLIVLYDNRDDHNRPYVGSWKLDVYNRPYVGGWKRDCDGIGDFHPTLWSPLPKI